MNRLVVLAHRGAAEMVRRHYPNWDRFTRGSTICWVTPVDDALEGMPGLTIRIGRSEREGQSCIDRMRVGARLLSEKSTPGLGAIIEADCLFTSRGDLNPEYVQEGELWMGSRWGSGDRKFLGTCFGHCPWIARPATWERIYRSPFGGLECGTPDRWLGYIAEREGIALEDLGGFCDNTIEPERFADMQAAVARGRFSVHGVKTQACFDAVMSAMKGL